MTAQFKSMQSAQRLPIRLVTYSVAEGLANRLRIHLIAHAYALHSRARLVVNWPVVKACGARYDDLFEFTDVIRDGSRPGFYGSALATLKSRRIRLNGTQPPAFRDVRDLSVPRAGLVDFGEVFRPFAYEDAGRVLGPFKQRVIESLRPVDAVRCTISSLRSRLSSPYLGIHIRRGDFSVSFSEHLLSLDFYRLCLRLIIENCPGIRFYLSTDDDKFVGPLVQEFSPLVHSKHPRQSDLPSFDVFGYDNRCNRDTVLGVRDSLVDLFMLSGSRVLLGAPASSFSSIAGLLGGTTLVIPRTDSDAEAERCAMFISEQLATEVSF